MVVLRIFLFLHFWEQIESDYNLISSDISFSALSNLFLALSAEKSRLWSDILDK